jgi:hypothetical protein
MNISRASSENMALSQTDWGTTFVQSRFRDEQELAHRLHVLQSLGIATDNMKSQGLFHAERFVSRLEPDVHTAPLSLIGCPCSGQPRPVGMRCVLVSGLR